MSSKKTSLITEPSRVFKDNRIVIDTTINICKTALKSFITLALWSTHATVTLNVWPGETVLLTFFVSHFIPLSEQ